MDWRDRFRAGVVQWATRARSNPARGVVITDRDGNDEAYAWDVPSRELRRVSDAGTAVLEAAISPDGSSIVFLLDTTGSEFGHLVRVPFEGGEPVDLTPDLDQYLAYEIVIGESVITAVIGFADDQRLLCVRDGRSHMWDQEGLALAAVVSEDESRIAIGEPADGLIGRTVVRSLVDGSEIDRLERSIPWVARGGSFAVGLHRDGWLRPAIWTPGSDPEPIKVDVPGDVVPGGTGLRTRGPSSSSSSTVRWVGCTWSTLSRAPSIGCRRRTERHRHGTARSSTTASPLRSGATRRCRGP